MNADTKSCWSGGKDSPVPMPNGAGAIFLSMGLIDEFIARYRREYDYFDQTTRLIAQALDSNLLLAFAPWSPREQ